MYKMIDFLLILGFSLSYFIYTSIVKINYYFAIALLLLLIVLFLFLHSRKCIDKEKLKSYKWIVLPEIFLIIYGFFSMILGDCSVLEIKKYFARALLYVTTSFGAVAMYDLYGKKSLKILLYAMLLNYAFYIFMALKLEGFYAIKIYLQAILKGDTTASSILEAHEITFSFGLLFLYYYLMKNREYKKNAIVSFIIFVLGFKRIGMAAVIIVMICDFFISKIKNNQILKKMYGIAGLIFLSASFLWIYMVKNDYFSIISQKYNINFMGRIDFYSYVKNEFDLSILFLGRGLGYVTSFGVVNGFITSIHSNVLEMYIDIGMLAYTVYCYNKLALNSKRILVNNNYKKANNYFLIMIYIFILWFTDNVATYLNFIFTANVIFLNIINNLDEKKEKKKDENKLSESFCNNTIV